ncbi:peptidase inhibitor family I36 protein [Streptomyces sp. NBC_01102]|uniref:peptidase inhibitor family I36 protein n=1 Tax=Streptomyces sp. NBC_01102 TaxID=2903749 RepID=UPI0038708CE0|nr:peptidase inhibitor family I36 protein [Streptomyces sp. NBC_01102]
MEWKKKSAAILSTLAIVGGGMMLTATPASAVADCPAARLCIYDGTNFTGDRITSASTNACFYPWDTSGFNSIRSYVSNSSVTAKVWEYNGSSYTAVRTMPAGGFSSDIGTAVAGGYWDKVCLGNATP